jgi:hypothetical protein
MNKSQIADLKVRLENIQNMDIENIISTVFSDQDVNNIFIVEYTIPEYVSMIKRLISQFINEFESNGYYLPFQYSYSNEFGNGNLQSDLQVLYDQINARTHNHLNSTITYLNRLIYYQISNGFWDKHFKKNNKISETHINDLNNQLSFIANHLKINTENFNALSENLNIEKKNLQEFIIIKNQELQQISNNLQTSNTNTNQIAQLLTNSTSTFEKINSLLLQQTTSIEHQNTKFEIADTYFTEQQKNFKLLEENVNLKITEISNYINSFNEKLQFVESKRAFFEERNNYLNELIGREVGASLFETFKQRKLELVHPVNKWLLIVISMSVLTFLAILTIFTNAFGWLGIPKELTTLLLITNSIKTLPFFFLLFYSIAQYNKERNFQEEYAFKSAVALTIKAYADIINKGDLKDELIINSVNGIYKSPTIYKSKRGKEENSILDTAKELLNTAKELIKK